MSEFTTIKRGNVGNNGLRIHSAYDSQGSCFVDEPNLSIDSDTTGMDPTYQMLNKNDTNNYGSNALVIDPSIKLRQTIEKELRFWLWISLLAWPFNRINDRKSNQYLKHTKSICKNIVNTCRQTYRIVFSIWIIINTGLLIIITGINRERRECLIMSVIILVFQIQSFTLFAFGIKSMSKEFLESLFNALINIDYSQKV